MIGRTLSLLLLVFLGAAWGWSRESPTWTLAGALLGALVWVSRDSVNGARLLRWLNSGEASGAPNLKGLWGELLDRNRKVFKKLEKKAQKSDARLEDFLSAIQASPNGVLLLDETGAIEWCNQTAAAQLGLDPQRDLGQTIRNLVRSPAFVAYMAEGDFSHEIQIDGPGQRPTQPNRISVQIHPYGRKRRLMLTRDVTAVQLAEAMRRDFVANVSHEIRTPLTVLSGFVETLQTLPLEPDERERYLGLMAQQANRMQSLVSDLLTLSKLEGSPSPNRQSRVSARELLDKCVVDAQGLSAALARGAHQFAEHVQADVWLLGNVDELTSAVGNLLGNAVRYTPGHGSISVGVRQLESGEVELWVSDTGPGVAPEHIPRLTERFYRVDRSRSRETGGTGLGLAIVKHVIQRHGGQLLIQSQLGAGSTFTLRFPPDRVRPL